MRINRALDYIEENLDGEIDLKQAAKQAYSSVSGDTKMKVRIEQKPAFTVAGVKRTFRSDAPVNLVPQFWSDVPQENYKALLSLMDTEPRGFIGLCADFDGEHSFDYYIAAATTKATPSGMDTYKVPAATWAILERDGELTKLVNRFWSEWLPSSGYRRADENVPDVEVYPELDMPKENYKYELWFPVVKE
jgi:AraC family transcriptional regulator